MSIASDANSEPLSINSRHKRTSLIDAFSTSREYTQQYSEPLFLHKSICLKIFEWICNGLLGIAQGLVTIYASPHHQCIPGSGDSNCWSDKNPALGYHVVTDTLTMSELLLLCFIIWIFIIGLSMLSNISQSGCRASFSRHRPLINFLLMIEVLFREVMFTILAAELFGNLIRRYVGRPRPNYYTSDESSKRLSFPSGHTITAFSLLGLLSFHLISSFLYIQKHYKPRRNQSSVDVMGPNNPHLLFFGQMWIALRETIILPFIITLIPIYVATWVACTRLVTFWHHYTDVLTGAAIGLLFSGLAFKFFEHEIYPKLVYTSPERPPIL